MAVRPSERFPLYPRTGEVVILVDDKGRMVKRVRYLAHAEGDPRRAWCWLEGDNPKLSEDSRYYGWVPSHRVEAVVVAVAWPPWRAQWLIDGHRIRQAASSRSKCHKSESSFSRL